MKQSRKKERLLPVLNMIPPPERHMPTTSNGMRITNAHKKH